MKIIYFLGRGRSGSTLFSSILGSQERVFNTGELKNFHVYSTRKDRLDTICSDGVLFKEHPFWNDVKEYLQTKIGNKTPNLLDNSKDNFEKNNLAIYEAIQNVSKTEIIVDVSKKFSRYKKLDKLYKNNLNCIFLIKDPRAYALSVFKSNDRRVLKKKKGRNIFGKRVLKNKKGRSIFFKLLWWNLYNTFMYFYLKLFVKNYKIFRYEDFVQKPFEFAENYLIELNLYSEKEKIKKEIINQPVFSGNVFFIEKTNNKIKFDYSNLEKISKLNWFIWTLTSISSILLYKYSLTDKYNSK